VVPQAVLQRAHANDFQGPIDYFGARGGAVSWGTALQAGKSRVRFPMVSLKFFIEVIPGVE
jgi:hypothetical protein